MSPYVSSRAVYNTCICDGHPADMKSDPKSSDHHHHCCPVKHVWPLVMCWLATPWLAAYISYCSCAQCLRGHSGHAHTHTHTHKHKHTPCTGMILAVGTQFPVGKWFATGGWQESWAALAATIVRLLPSFLRTAPSALSNVGRSSPIVVYCNA
jgi:hypothetical protein